MLFCTLNGSVSFADPSDIKKFYKSNPSSDVASNAAVLALWQGIKKSMNDLVGESKETNAIVSGNSPKYKLSNTPATRDQALVMIDALILHTLLDVKRENHGVLYVTREGISDEQEKHLKVAKAIHTYVQTVGAYLFNEVSNSKLRNKIV